MYSDRSAAGLSRSNQGGEQIHCPFENSVVKIIFRGVKGGVLLPVSDVKHRARTIF